jgi:hypothetical protein
LRPPLLAKFCQLREALDCRGIRFVMVLAKSVGHCDRDHARVPGGMQVNVGIADHSGFPGCDSKFFQNGEGAAGIRFFLSEAVASIDSTKESRQAQAFQEFDA